MLNLSPLGPLETVKPAAILSRHALAYHLPPHGVGERLELRRRPAHVSRAAENNRVARVELGKNVVVLVTAFDDVIAADGDEVGFDAGDGRRAFDDGFGEFGRVAGAGEIDDGYGWHNLFGLGVGLLRFDGRAGDAQ